MIYFSYDQNKNERNIKVDMKSEYDLKSMKVRKNPYAADLKKQVTIRMGVDVIEYFKGLAQETGMPYQVLIDLYLRDCVKNKRKLKFQWSA